MKKIFLMILLFILVSCSVEENLEDFENISFGDGEYYSVEIFKNNINKTAEIHVIEIISNEEEWADYLGTKRIYTPFIINVACNTTIPILFTEDKPIKDLPKENEKILSKDLRDYEILNVSITFVDAENGENIAKCYSHDSEEIKFEAYREYEPSMTVRNAVIGVY